MNAPTREAFGVALTHFLSRAWGSTCDPPAPYDQAMPTSQKGLRFRSWPTAVGLVALVGLAALIAAWPDWTLRYVHALAWPAVALIAVATFGPALARRVPSLSALHLPGGVVATFDQQQETYEETDYAAELTSPEAWGPAIEDPGDGPAELAPEEQDPLALANEAIRLLGTIVGAFQMQLDFLRALAGAENGLTHAAASQWFADVIATKRLDPTTWEPEALITWLRNQGAITLAQDGTYRLTRFGDRIVAALGLSGLFVAPKAV